MSNEEGKQSEKTPDYIPGWFAPGPGNPGTIECEAVRIVDRLSFPLAFFRGGEAVWMPEKRSAPIRIARLHRPGLGLSVEPGDWITRGFDGTLFGWGDESFKLHWIRNNGREWIPPADRRCDWCGEPLNPKGGCPNEFRHVVQGNDERPFDTPPRKLKGVADDLEDEVERLLREREEARTRESRFAEERDCAFALLRWLLPTTVAKRLDE